MIQTQEEIRVEEREGGLEGEGERARESRKRDFVSRVTLWHQFRALVRIWTSPLISKFVQVVIICV